MDPTAETVPLPQAVATQPATPDAPPPTPPADQAETQPIDQPDGTQPAEPAQTTDQITQREFIIARKDEDIDKAARELASKEVSEEARKGNILDPRNTLRKIKYALAGKAIRQRRIKKYEKKFREDDNAYGGDVATQQAAEEATLKGLRTQLEHKRETGEELTEIDKIEEANNDVRQLIVDRIIKDYVVGNITGTEEQVQREFQNRLTQLVKDSQDRSKPGFTDAARQQITKIFGEKAVASGKLADAFVIKELVEAAKWVQDNYKAHTIAIDQIQNAVKFQLANPSWAAATEANLTTVDKVVRWTEQKWGGSLGVLLSPTVIGVAASIGELALSKGTGTAARILSPVLTPIVAPFLGGVVSFFKRRLELKQNVAQLRAEQAYNEKSSAIPAGGKTFVGRFSGEYRRADLEKFNYDTARAVDLKIAVDNILAKDTLTQTDREGLIQAVADIEARLKFSLRNQVDLITFGSRGNVSVGRAQLKEAKHLALRKLRETAASTDQLNEEIKLYRETLNDKYDSFKQSKAQKDRELNRYIFWQAAGAAGFGAAAAIASGVITQQGLAWIARASHWGEGGGPASWIFRKGETSFEKMINAGWTAFGNERINFAGAGTGLGVDVLRNLYNNPTDVAIPGQQMWLGVDFDHHASLKDAMGNPIPTPPMEVSKDGHLMVLGRMDKVPQPVKDFLKSAGWTEKLTSDPSFSLQEKMAHAYKLGTPAGHETFRYGNFNIDLESGANHQMSMTLHPGYPDEIRVHGFMEMDASGHPNLNIDGSFNGNASLDTSQISLIKNELARSGWPDPKIDLVHIPGKSQLVQANEYFRSQGALQPTARELWHDNGTPMHFVNGHWLGADGKELQFYHRITPDGKYIELDFSKMESQFRDGVWRNWDYTSDNQYNRVVHDIVRQPDGSNIFHNFQLMFTPNEQANSLREAVVFGEDTHPELGKGLFRLPLDSTEARAFFKLDENGHPIFNKFGNFQGASYIEVAHKQANNLRTILSTTQGDGVSQITIPGKDIDYQVFHLSPPQATELIPPGGGESPYWFDVIPTRFQPLPPGTPGEERFPPPPPSPPEKPKEPPKEPPPPPDKDEPDKDDKGEIDKEEFLDQTPAVPESPEPAPVEEEAEIEENTGAEPATAEQAREGINEVIGSLAVDDNLRERIKTAADKELLNSELLTEMITNGYSAQDIAGIFEKSVSGINKITDDADLTSKIDTIDTDIKQQIKGNIDPHLTIYTNDSDRASAEKVLTYLFGTDPDLRSRLNSETDDQKRRMLIELVALSSYIHDVANE